ncbi:unnamed protein product [Strongylus vulgaris]|uniref:Uncharacterized protein n=1 Tax=Strongylus vulgaris TaxID=40348 RepID=A0A3P7IKW6_STRVU|nr:unnamed protein product [Strongylus vulgaris]
MVPYFSSGSDHCLLRAKVRFSRKVEQKICQRVEEKEKSYMTTTTTCFSQEIGHQESAKEEKSTEAGADCTTFRASGLAIAEQLYKKIFGSTGKKYRKNLLDYRVPLTALLDEDGTRISSQQKMITIFYINVFRSSLVSNPVPTGEIPLHSTC